MIRMGYGAIIEMAIELCLGLRLWLFQDKYATDSLVERYRTQIFIMKRYLLNIVGWIVMLFPLRAEGCARP